MGRDVRRNMHIKREQAYRSKSTRRSGAEPPAHQQHHAPTRKATFANYSSTTVPVRAVRGRRQSQWLPIDDTAGTALSCGSSLPGVDPTGWPFHIAPEPSFSTAAHVVTPGVARRHSGDCGRLQRQASSTGPQVSLLAAEACCRGLAPERVGAGRALTRRHQPGAHGALSTPRASRTPRLPRPPRPRRDFPATCGGAVEGIFRGEERSQVDETRGGGDVEGDPLLRLVHRRRLVLLSQAVAAGGGGVARRLGLLVDDPMAQVEEPTCGNKGGGRRRPLGQAPERKPWSDPLIGIPAARIILSVPVGSPESAGGLLERWPHRLLRARL